MIGMNDTELVHQCLQGKAGAFENLVLKYQKQVFNAAFRLVSNTQDAEDITQNVFLKAYENLNKFKPRYKFYSWIYRIAINESLNVLQSRKYTDDVTENQYEGSDNPHSQVSRNETDTILQNALRSIQFEYRILIVMKHFLQCSYLDISKVLDLPVKKVKSRLYMARQLLARELVNRGVEADG